MPELTNYWALIHHTADLGHRLPEEEHLVKYVQIPPTHLDRDGWVSIPLSLRHQALYIPDVSGPPPMRGKPPRGLNGASLDVVQACRIAHRCLLAGETVSFDHFLYRLRR